MKPGLNGNKCTARYAAYFGNSGQVSADDEYRCLLLVIVTNNLIGAGL